MWWDSSMVLIKVAIKLLFSSVFIGIIDYVKNDHLNQYLYLEARMRENNTTQTTQTTRLCL